MRLIAGLAALVLIAWTPQPVAAVPNGCVAAPNLPCTFAASESPARVTGTCRGIFVSASIIALFPCRFDVRLGGQVLASCVADLPAAVCTSTSSAPVPSGATLTCAVREGPAIAAACTTGA